MRGYLVKDPYTANEEMAALHELVGQLTRRLKGVRCKLFVDNYFCSCAFFFIICLPEK